jgi:glycosyltransferase involved in cell wall biosynthesis
VVATDNSGPRLVINDGIDGILVEAGNARAVVEATLRVTNDPVHARSMSAAAADTARHYTWARTAAGIASFYQRRLASRAQGRESR